MTVVDEQAIPGEGERATQLPPHPDDDDPQTETPPLEPQPGTDEPLVETPAEPGGDEAGGGSGEDVSPSNEPPPVPPAGNAPLVQVECAKCGHMNTLEPDTSVYPLSPSSKFRSCDDCDGMGKVMTGSLVSGKMVETCPTCKGNGYLSATGETPAAPTPVDLDEPPWPGATKDERGNWH